MNHEATEIIDSLLDGALKGIETKLNAGEDIAKAIPLFFGSIFNETGDIDTIARILKKHSEKGFSGNEIRAAYDFMSKKMTLFPTPAHLQDSIIDCCGTGGDNHNTFNISTTVAFVAAGSGVPVTKHGNRSVSSKSGSSDVLSELGIKIDCDESQMVKALEAHNICFLFAPLYHGYMAKVAPIRAMLKCRTIFNIMGPLINPAKPKRQLIGVFDKMLVSSVALSLQLRKTDGLVVHGELGEDEMSVCGNTIYTETKDIRVGNSGQASGPKTFTPEKTYDISELKGGDAAHNAKALRELLAGNQDKAAYYDSVVLNAGAAIYVGGKADSIEDGMAKAEQSIKNGAALAALDGLVKITNESS